MNRARIKELDALKGIAFIGIFLLHVQCGVEWAAFGVCLFLFFGCNFCQKGGEYNEKLIM